MSDPDRTSIVRLLEPAVVRVEDRTAAVQVQGPSVVRSTTGGGEVLLPPVNTVAPVLTGSALPLRVGDTLTWTEGTWTGTEPIAFTSQVTRDGVDVIGATTQPYTVVVADAGAAMGVDVRGVNLVGSATAASNTIVVAPYYAAAPTIAAGSEPWAGGTVTMTPATPSGEDSETYDWLLDAVSTGTDALSYAVPVDRAGDALVPRQTATNAGGSTTVDGSGVTIEALRGITRANPTTADWPRINGFGSIPAEGTILAECITAGLDAVGATLFSWMDPSGQPNRYGVVLRVLEAGQANALVYVASNGFVRNVTGAAVPGAYDGSTRSIVAVRWRAADMSVSVIVPGGSVSSTAGTGIDPSVTAAGVDVDAFEFNGGVTSARGTQGSLEGAGFTRYLSDAELDAIAAAGSLRAWGAYSDGSLAWALYPEQSTESDGTTITTTAQLAGGSWTISGDGTRMTSGGLNEATS